MHNNIYTKLTRWEFWPTWLLYFPVLIQYLYHSIRSQSFFYYSAVNPEIEAGGLFGASKIKQLAFLHKALIPNSTFIGNNISLEELLTIIEKYNYQYPIIAKPDKAERGIGIELIKNEGQLIEYFKKAKYEFILQEYINFTFEAGVFFYRMPNEQTGKITSIVIKELLHVKGDGKKNIETLMKNNYRASLVIEKQKHLGTINFKRILAADEVLLLEPIGNHNRGTMFINGNHYINPILEKTINEISRQLPSFYYGRFDLRAPNIEDFVNGKNLKIMEVNGVNAEPAHIYDPSTKLVDGLKTLLVYWKVIFKISQINIKAGIKPMRFREAKSHYRNWKAVKT